MIQHTAVFFDRDDTLMVNVPYLGDPAGVQLFPEAIAALSALRQAGFLLFLVSNQSGVGRGLITREQVAAVNRELARQLGPAAGLTHCYSSFEAPNAPVLLDRKPSPALLHQAAAAHHLELTRSFFVGDRLSDIECGRAGGCRTIFLAHPHSSRALVRAGQEEAAAERLADYSAGDLLAASRWILAQAGSASSRPASSRAAAPEVA